MSLFKPAGIGKTPAPVMPVAGKGINFTPAQIEQMKKTGLWDGPPSPSPLVSTPAPQDYTRDKNNQALLALFAQFINYSKPGGWSPTKKGIVPRESTLPVKGGGVQAQPKDGYFGEWHGTGGPKPR